MNRTFGRTQSSSNKKNIVLVLGGMTVAVLLVVASLVLFATGTKAPEKQAAAVVKTENAEPAVKMVDVLIPSQTIEAGSQLDASMFRREVRPQVGVSARVVKDVQEIQGQFAKSMIIAGQPLHRDYLSSIKPVSNVSPKIPDGYRAVAISVTSTSAVEGWAQPGSKVDVSWGSTLNGKPSISVIVQNAKILSAERQRGNDPKSGRDGKPSPIPSTVTLEVTSEDAQKIQLASSSGSLSLSLRGDKDTGKGQPKGTVTIDDLLGMSKNTDQKNKAGNKIRVRSADGKWDEFYFVDGKLEPVEKAQP